MFNNKQYEDLRMMKITNINNNRVKNNILDNFCIMIYEPTLN